EMLQAAEHPVREDMVSIPDIRLARANAHMTDFPPQSFDFIYSLGVFGDGCGVTTDLLNKFYDWLAPGGKLFFNNVDFAGLPFWYQMRRRLRDLAYPILPRRWQVALDERQAKRPFLSLSRRILARLLRRSKFGDHFQIQSFPCESPLGWGRHLECVATKI